jgi:hypothetical protein
MSSPRPSNASSKTTEVRKLSSLLWGRRLRLPSLLLAASPGTWTSPATHLTWATADNGSGVTYSEAQYYCGDRAVPTIDELRTLSGGPAADNDYHILGPIRLTGWQWSSTPGKQPGEQWALDFGDGGQASVVAGDSGLNRVLCLRRDR